MVRNTIGGNRTKGQARKMVSQPHSTKLRVSQDENEQYACVVKIYGQGRISVQTVGGLEMQCIIRNKFRGRSKRGNIINVGTILMVGMRDWEAPNYKTCDVLEVYDVEEVARLKSVPSSNINSLSHLMQSKIKYVDETNDESASFQFCADGEGVVDEIKQQKLSTEEPKNIDTNNAWLNIDDI
jgi:translation initiation factor IF-1